MDDPVKTLRTERPRGRPRSEPKSAAILDATAEILSELGFAGLSIDAVAARSGVARASIYLRWPSKDDLVMDAVRRELDQAAPIPDTGALRTDLIAVGDLLVKLFTRTRAGRISLLLVGEATTDPRWDEHISRLNDYRRSAARAVVERAVERGEIAADVDADLLLDLVSGAVLHRIVFAKTRPTRRVLERIVDAAMRGTVREET